MSAAAECAINDTYTQNSGTEGLGCGNAAGNYYIGTYFTPTGNINVCKVVMYLDVNGGDISGKTFVCEIWANSSNNLGSKLGTSAGVTGGAWSATLVDFSFASSVALTSGTTYIVTLTMNEVDAVNNANGHLSATDVWAFGNAARWASNGVRGANFATQDMRFRYWGN